MHSTELIVQNLTKQFVQGTHSVDVLNGISVRFQKGKTYAITGASGSGKSTFLHMLAGIDRPTSGSILFEEKSIIDASPTQRSYFLTHSVGLVFQYPYLIQELSVVENVGLKGLINGVPYPESIEKAHLLLKMVGLDGKAQAQPSTLSGGQQQRVAIARALFNKPAFLIADEPTGNLDEQTSLSVINFLHDCQKEWGMGLVISSHNPYVAQSMDYTYHLHNGKLTLQEENKDE